MRKETITVAAVGIVGALAALWVAPGAPSLSAAGTGDGTLAAEARAALDDPDGYRGVAVAIVEKGQVRTAGLGRAGGADDAPVRPDTPFEIGSVGKTFTGMLLADLVADGTVRPDDRLDSALPEVRGPAGEVTLAELASHRSGLPRVPTTSPGHLIGTWWASVRAADPYDGQDRQWLIRAANGEKPGERRGEVDYSNFGMGLLGQALAARADRSYPDLVTERILAPLGMQRTSFALDGAPLPDGHASGGTAAGRAAAPWTGSGWAPAGVGVWSTAEDLARLTGALLAGSAPGGDAATPRFDDDDRTRIGYGWFTTRYDDREIVWHTGGTGGSSSFVGVDRATGRAVVLLGNTDQNLDDAGLRLLGVPRDSDAPDSRAWIGVGLALAFSLLGGASLLGTARKGPDRLALVTAALWAAATLLGAYRLGNWLLVPGWVWAGGVGLGLAGLVLAAIRWRRLPLNSGGAARARWWRWTETGLSTLFVALFTAALIA
jgi:CubicO group peptidase (beta-lactamase class C family)